MKDKTRSTPTAAASSSEQQTESVRRAVALKYEPGERTAPVVVAKGKGYLANAIVEKAAENGVPVQEDASLVEVLSKLDLNQEIPPELYTLVAEILSFIYRSDKRAGGYDD